MMERLISYLLGHEYMAYVMAAWISAIIGFSTLYYLSI
jgi:hypothetical protein